MQLLGKIQIYHKLIFISLNLLTIISQTDQTKTKMLITLFDQGSTKADSNYPNFPVTEGQETFGDLSTSGIRQQYNLGNVIKQRFSNIFDNPNKSSQITFYTSSSRASVASAVSQTQAFFSGNSIKSVETLNNRDLILPPSVDTFNNSSDSNSAPIDLVAIRPMDSANDFMFDAFVKCPGFVSKIEDKVSENEETHADFISQIYSFLENNGFSAQTLTNNASWSIKSSSKFIDAYLSSVWLTNNFNYFKILSHFTFFRSFFQNLKFSDKNLNNSINTPLFWELKDIISKLKSDIQDDSAKFQMKLFSAHASNIVLLLNSINYSDSLLCLKGFYNFRIKDETFNSMEDYQNLLHKMNEAHCVINTTFAANTIIEIYQKETPGVDAHEDLAINVYLNNNQIPGLSISLNDFEDLLNNGINANFNSDCDLPSLNKDVSKIGVRIFSYIAFGFMAVGLVMLSLMLCFSKKPEQKKQGLYTTSDSRQELISHQNGNQKDDFGVSEGKTKNLDIKANYNYDSKMTLPSLIQMDTPLATDINTPKPKKLIEENDEYQENIPSIAQNIENNNVQNRNQFLFNEEKDEKS